jgi:hypothetical protein
MSDEDGQTLPKLPAHAYLLDERQIGRCKLETERPENWGVWANQLIYIKNEFEGGNILALYDGIVMCRAAEIPLPGWLAEGLQSFMVAALTDGISGTPGRSNAPFARIKADIVKQIRAYTVWTIRGFQSDGSEMTHMRLSPSAMVALFEGRFDGFGYNASDAFEMASIALRGSIAQGGAEGMKSAFQNTIGVNPNAGFAETMTAFGLSWLDVKIPTANFVEIAARWRLQADKMRDDARSRQGRKGKR